MIPMRVGWYNDVVPDTYKLPMRSAALLIMVGNTKHLWQYFIDYINPENLSEHPLNDYVMHAIMTSLHECRRQSPTVVPTTHVGRSREYETSLLI